MCLYVKTKLNTVLEKKIDLAPYEELLVELVISLRDPDAELPNFDRLILKNKNDSSPASGTKEKDRVIPNDEWKPDPKYVKVGNVYYNPDLRNMDPYELKQKQIEAVIKKKEEDIAWLAFDKPPHHEEYISQAKKELARARESLKIVQFKAKYVEKKEDKPKVNLQDY